ncbi:hypothetical protein LTR50_006762 [Elasticomyces elasticus]|nr:hypothetical protein LTR50_006762 [Elasticomyces elasticus]
MPPQPGEVLLCTLFADLHYYFSPPTLKPQHHRFDKGSYVYLYHNAVQRRGRLEVANYAGTSDQDAFSGYLDTSSIRNSDKHLTLFTVTVDNKYAVVASSPQQDLSQWHLPAFDPRNEKKNLYRMHTIDVYFWTAEDASFFRNSLRQILPAEQLEILDAPAQSLAEHHDSMSPVVQQLEQAVIGGPYYPRTGSTSTAQSFPGPWTPSTTAGASSPAPAATQHNQNFAPAAYNPAAPAAPEPIAHREKTPPPADAEGGTGLAAAAIHEHGAQHPVVASPFHQQPYQQQQRQSSYFSGSPSQQALGQNIPPPPPPTSIQQMTPSAPQPQRTASGSFPPPPPAPPASHPGSQQNSQPFTSQPQDLSPQQFFNLSGTQQQQPHAHRQSSYQSHTQYTTNPQSPGFPPVQSPGYAPLQSPGVPATPSAPPSYFHHIQQNSDIQTPLQSPSLPPPPTQVPVGGFSSYNYGHGQPNPQQTYTDPNALYAQAYRPTQGEVGHSHTLQQSQVQPQTGGQQPGKQGLEARLGKVEKGVGRFLKKLDQRF